MRPRVLIIEDNPADAAFAREMLDGLASSIVVAPRLSDALEHVDEADVALLDMDLPDATGIDALNRLRSAAPGLPVVILSGDRDEAKAMAAVQAGAQDYLLKGNVSQLSLHRAVAYAVERQNLQERLAASIHELEGQRSAVMTLNQLKNDLIAVLAHDIKGPLTSIVGFAELIEQGFYEGDASVDAARTIRNSAQRLATLANDVLALSRVEHGELEIEDERVDLRTLLEETIELHVSERAIDLEGDLDDVYVRGDFARLRQVFENLLRNAIKYSPNEMPVTVAVRRDGDTMIVSVIDRGIGIPQAEIPVLFERFARASNARKAKIPGTGIGLFVVKMIVERHGGSIDVSSAIDEGSRFDVRLPRIGATEFLRPLRVTLLTKDDELSRFLAYELRTRGYRLREVQDVDQIEHPDLREGDVLIVDCASVDPSRLQYDRAKLRAIGLGSTGSGWCGDIMLERPFLMTDLIAAIGAPASRLIRQ